MGIAGTFFAILAALMTIIGGSFAFYKWSYGKGFNDARDELVHSNRKRMYEEVYSPLIRLFKNLHINTAQTILAPTVWHRLKYVWKDLREFNFVQALRSFFDNKEKP